MMDRAGSQILLLKDSQQQPDRRFLRFPLNSEIDGLVPLADLQGVINVLLKEILPVPQVSEFLLGIINWQGEAVWILDLVGLLGATHWCRKETVPLSGMAMLIRSEGQTVGLLVEKVSTIETYDPRQLLPVSASMVPEELLPFIKAYSIAPEGKLQIILDLNAAIESLQNF